MGSVSDLEGRNYLRWDAKDIECVPANEKEDIQKVADMFNDVQRAFFNKTRHCYSGTHARTQGIVKGKFIVSDDLPSHLKQTELFSSGGEYDAACRYSSEPSDPGLDVSELHRYSIVGRADMDTQDRIPQPRGFAIKVFGVNGPRFPEGEGLTTHDIEFNSTPALDLADAKTTKEIVDLRMKHGDNQPELYRHLECRHDIELQKGRDRIHNTHMESTRQYSQTTYRFGDYVINFCLVPTGETQKKLYNETIKPDDGDDILHRWLQSFHKDHNAEYEFQVQLLENTEDQPVEYAGKAWDAEKYPWQTVAKLVIPRQNSFDYDRKTFWEDQSTAADISFPLTPKKKETNQD